MSTRVLSSGESQEPHSGQTLWGSQLGNTTAGLAWDWVEVCAGVVAMADPFGVITNLQLVDEHGEQLPAIQVARCINEIVHELPWQAEVQAALGQAASSGEATAPAATSAG